MILTENSTATYSPCPAGAYPARCVSLIDLGTVTTDWQGQTKQARKIIVQWEILDDEIRRDDGEPYLMTKRYTASLHEKSALRKDLASYRGRDFTPEELRGFDLKTVLGAPCLLSVVHAEREGRTYANVSAIMRTPKGSTPPEAQSPLLHWSMDAPDWSAFARLPKRIQDQVSESPEFKRLDVPRSIPLTTATPAPSYQNAPTPAAAPRPAPMAPPAAAAPPAPAAAFDPFEDDIPF